MEGSWDQNVGYGRLLFLFQHVSTSHFVFANLIAWKYGCQRVWDSVVWCHFVFKSFMQHHAARYFSASI
jgi:hypothetical protein